MPSIGARVGGLAKHVLLVRQHRATLFGDQTGLFTRGARLLHLSLAAFSAATALS